ncbi:transcriptional repressor LexA [Patescibacteria group bacterium AH-259-L05]|nr:transcriptional repressor LexA [Patescibacteria group bacterium AH-259-L05]
MKNNKNNKTTPRQKLVLQIIYNAIKSSGFPPTLADLREALNVVSNQGVLEHLAALEKKGFIKREHGSARGIRILPKTFKLLNLKPLVPFMGESSAGPFVEAIEQTGEWKTISDEVAQFQDRVFLIKVHGDSMIGAGINNGDIVLVKEAKEFSNNDIVLVRMDGETTVKRFVKHGKTMYLKPENPKYENIYFDQDTDIQPIGIVITNLGKK